MAGIINLAAVNMMATMDNCQVWPMSFICPAIYILTGYDPRL